MRIPSLCCPFLSARCASAPLVLAAALIAAAISIVAAGSAFGQGVCGFREHMMSLLGKEYGEAAAARGLIGDSGLMELWTNPAEGSWSVLITTTGGVACLVFSGQGFEALPLPASPKPDEGS